MTNKHASNIIEYLGEPLIMSALGMSRRSIRHARRNGFSGLHYETLKTILAAKGEDCPLCAFVWKKAVTQ